LEPEEAGNRHSAALACLAADDRAASQVICSDALAYFQSDDDPAKVRDLSALFQLDLVTPEQARQLLGRFKQALAARPENPIYRREYAIVSYRSGEWQEALERLEQYCRMGVGPRVDLLGGTFLAMSYERLGCAKEAKEVWEDVSRRSEEWLREPVQDGGPDWAARLTLARLRQELERSFSCVADRQHAVARN
jgi:hypothetical protein